MHEDSNRLCLVRHELASDTPRVVAAEIFGWDRAADQFLWTKYWPADYFQSGAKLCMGGLKWRIIL
jgi:hypothetical protein